MNRFWIFKSEPGEFSISDLKEQGCAWWDGVRNYQARNYMRQMTKGEKVFFYHSSCPQPGIVGTAVVSQEARREETTDKGEWSCVEIAYESTAPLLSLTALKELPLGDCPLTRKGNRLSIIPLTDDQYQIISEALEA